MSEFTIRSESVDVEQIMKQIRQRLLEKRGQDYTEEQIRELASVRLEKFLDPKNLRSDLLEQFRKSRPAVPSADIEPPKIQPPYAFDDQTLFTSHRAVMRLARKLLNPILKLFFNPNTLNQVLHAQAQFNVDMLKREARRSVEQRSAERAHAISRGEWNALYYEVLHNIVLETTRMGIEVQNLRMKVESLSSRLDFSERRVRALEGVVQYRPEAVRSTERRERDDDYASVPAPAGAGAAVASGAVAGSGAPGGIEGFVPGTGEGAGRRRRRRRRGRRGQGAPGGPGAQGQQGQGGFNAPQDDQTSGVDQGDDDDASDSGEPGETGETSDASDARESGAYSPASPDSLDSPDSPGSSDDDEQ